MSDQSLSETLNAYTHSLTAERVSVQDIIEHFEERSIAFFLFICALPAALPLPGLGVNLVIAAPLVLLTLQQAALRQHVWLPRYITQKTISKDRLVKLTEGAASWIKMAEALSKPRLQVISSDAFKPLIGLMGFTMALSVCIPLPLTNTVPSMGIAFMALGVLMKDGLAVIAGAFIGTAWIVLIGFTVIFLGVEGIDVIKEAIKSFI